MSADMLVRFWGVRGSIPVPGFTALRYGGNTACVEVMCGERRLILDAGTGIRGLGEALRRDGRRIRADLFLSHPHLDHVMGLPFFSPLYEAGSDVCIWTPDLGTTEDWLNGLIRPPFFPIPLAHMGANIQSQAYRPGTRITLGSDITVHTMPVPHPGGAAGLRIEFQGEALVYLTDFEASAEALGALAGFCRGAGALICDAMYADEEIELKRGWGHSTWQSAIALASAADARSLYLFHHAPERSDRALDEIGWAASTRFGHVHVASEGLCFRL